MRTGAVVLVVAVASVIALLTAWWAFALLPTPLPQLGPATGQRVDRTEVGNIFVSDIRTRTHAAERREEDAARLRSYGWVDQERGIASIPLEEATRIYLERVNGGRRGRDALRPREEEVQ